MNCLDRCHLCFSECTKDFGSIDKLYQDVFLPNAVENILTLAKKIQEKHVKSKAVPI